MIDVTAVTHGRINLIGEHTDYNNGWVLLAPTPQPMKIFITVRKDREVHASTSALHLPGSATLFYRHGEETKRNSWIDLVQGCTHFLSARGHSMPGFDFRIESTVPTGSGLASSSALIMGTLTALNKTFGFKYADSELAEMGQKIEK